MIDLEKNQAKSEKYSRRNNVEFINIPNDIPDNQLEDKVIRFTASRVWKLIRMILKVVIVSLPWFKI